MALRLAGGGAGMMEALVCHPLGRRPMDYLKEDGKAKCTSRYHQSTNAIITASTSARRKSHHRIEYRIGLGALRMCTQAKRRGFITTGAEIVKRETPLGLYKGLGAVLTGIVPKMAIRFTSYEWYKQLLANEEGAVSGGRTFLGIASN